MQFYRMTAAEKEAYFADARRRAQKNLAMAPAQRRAAAKAKTFKLDPEILARTRARHAEEKRALKAELAKVRADLADIPAMIADAEAGDLGGSDPAHVQGVLEEIDSMREQWQDRAIEIERLLKCK
jgi:hypothetical protein